MCLHPRRWRDSPAAPRRPRWPQQTNLMGLEPPALGSGDLSSWLGRDGPEGKVRPCCHLKTCTQAPCTALILHTSSSPAFSTQGASGSEKRMTNPVSAVQFSHSVMSNSLRPHGLQHTRPPCPSPTPRMYSNSCPSSRWCHPTILSSVIPFSSCLQSCPASESFPVSQFFTSSDQSNGVLASASVLPMDIQEWFPLGLTGLISLHSKGPSRASILWRSAFFMVQLSHPYMTTGKTIALTRQTFVDKVMSPLFNMLSGLVIAFLPILLISWLQSPSAVILEPKKIKSVTVSTVSPSIWHEVMGPDAMILFSECWALSQLFHSPLSLSSRGSSVSLRFLP